MPLYVEDFPPLSLPHPFMHALMTIGDAIGREPVNPSTALKLLHAYVQPLVPAQHRALLEVEGQPSWPRLHRLFPKFACASNGGQDKQMLAAATVVHLVVRHTTQPPRELQFPRFIEVTSFTRISGLLGIPVVAPCAFVHQRELPLYEFCKYCWLPARSHGVCSCHSSVRHEQGGDLPRCAGTTVKQVQRLSDSFEQQLMKLVSAEEYVFHDSGFAEPVLLPPSGLVGWLEARRPALAEAVRKLNPRPDSRPVLDLATVLYGDAAHSVATAISGSVHLLTPVTVRAEAWLLAWNGRPSWGGARPRVREQTAHMT